MIQFIPITKDNENTVLNLKIKTQQLSFIESIEDCLKEAKELSLWRPVGIYDNQVLIGFAMYGLWKEEGTHGRVWLDRFLIDQRFQGKGYGKKALQAIIKHIYQEYGYPKIYLSLYEDNLVALHLYQSLGFVFNGGFDVHHERIMVHKNPLAN